ncbi:MULTISPECIES: hypothetical protein [Parafrankia]|uniref:hypothetical protein n=1 Tax=Parafrankia TaxID=2994362 RepID=UPI0010427E35|nr:MULTISPECIES: hypothetical protein [Parafrankia]MBE3205749.1 hypothetical protein [Parafrankia sp. CH37]
MKTIWRESRVLRQDELPMELQDILRSGWLVGPAGSLLLKDLFGPGWRSDWPPETVAHHEREVNDVWIPPDGLPQERSLFLSGAVSRARSFALLAMESAQKFDPGDRLVAVISQGIDDDYRTHGATVKFFTRRGEYPRFYDDLEGYRIEAMAVVEPEDLAGNVVRHVDE